MKTLVILINKPVLNISKISENNYNYLKDYIDYKLQPYIKLGLFSYNTYRNTKPHLDGSDFPVHLLDALHRYTMPTHKCTNIFLSSECPAFFNIHTRQFYLSNNEYVKVCQAPYNYCLLYTDLYL